MIRKISNFLKGVFYYILCNYKIKKIKNLIEDDIIYTTKNNVQILVYPGKKSQSPFDFIVKFKIPEKRERIPKHIHIIVEMYVKHAFNPELTMKLRDHILEMFKHIKPVDYFPPKLQFFKPEHIEKFKELDTVGEFSVEFILVITELIAIQEKTNYPQGSLTERLYKEFGEKDRFTVIQKATWRNR